MNHFRCPRLLLPALVFALSAGCASAPVAVPPAPAQQLTFEQKMAWILRLEEDRVLRGAEPAAPPPPPVSSARGRGRVVPPPPPPPQPSLLTLLKDAESRIRRRAALAVGRTRVSEGVAA